jgi:putative glutamine amidotransferase
MSRPRIAIPQPCSDDDEYNQRAWPQYADAVTALGGEPVEVPLDASPAAIMEIINGCAAILLPGSGNDVNPQRYGAPRQQECNPPDPAREAVDELLLQDAHNLHKPIFGICYGAQSLNVWRTGTLVQHLNPLPVNHRAGRAVAVAHTVVLDPASATAAELAEDAPEELTRESVTVSEAFAGQGKSGPRLGVNSSHHQAIAIAGDGLRVVARCPQDMVIEAVEGTAPDHFVLGVQWHPERTFDSSAASRALFQRFLTAAAQWTPRVVTSSVAAQS